MLKKRIVLLVLLLIILLSFTIVGCSRNKNPDDSTKSIKSNDASISINEPTENTTKADTIVKITNYEEAVAFIDNNYVGEQFEFENARLKDDKKVGYILVFETQEEDIGIPVESDELNLNDYIDITVSGCGEIRSRSEDNGNFIYNNITELKNSSNLQTSAPNSEQLFRFSNEEEADAFFANNEDDGTQFEFTGAILTYNNEAKKYQLEYYHDMSSATGYPVESDELDLSKYVGFVISGKGELRSRPYKDGTFRYTDIVSIENKYTETSIISAEDAEEFYNHIEETGSRFTYQNGTVIKDDAGSFYLQFSKSDGTDEYTNLPVQSNVVDLAKHLDKSTSGRGELCYDNTNSLYYINITMIEEN